MEASTMTQPQRRSTRDRRPVERLTHSSTFQSLNGKRRVSIQEMAEAEPEPATPINYKKRRLAKIHVTPSSSITSPSFVCNSSSLKNHAMPSSIEPNSQHINPVLGRRTPHYTPSCVEPESHAKKHVTPSSAVSFPSFFSPTPYDPGSLKNHVTPLSIRPKVRSSQGTTTSLKDHFAPPSCVAVPSFVTTSQKNHLTSAFIKLKPQQIKLDMTTSQKNHDTSSSINPKTRAHSSLDSTMTPVSDRRSPSGESKRQQQSLTNLALRFHQIVATSGSNDIDLNVVVDKLGIPRRRIYDVVNILEGAGLIQRMKERNLYRLTRTPPVDLSLKPLYEEERQLDEWIKLKTEQVERVEAYVTSQHLAPFLDEDSTALAIATPRKSILHLPHNLEKQHETGQHVFMLIPPKTPDARRLPKAFLLENVENEVTMHPISLVPPPPLFEKCCSDFTIDQLNQILHVWDDADSDVQSLLKDLRDSHLKELKDPKDDTKPHHSGEATNKAAKPPREAIKSHNSFEENVKPSMPQTTEVVTLTAPGLLPLSLDSQAALHHVWVDDTKKATTEPQSSQDSPHHVWEMALDELAMPALLRESSSLVLCEAVAN